MRGKSSMSGRLDTVAAMDVSGERGSRYQVVDAGVAQLVERNLAKVEVASSSLVSRSSFKLFMTLGQPVVGAVRFQRSGGTVPVWRAGPAGVAQLVERNLAKVEVASSSLVSRSRYRGSLVLPLLFERCRRYVAGCKSK